MRLINYGLGEVYDRLTILSLKILYGTQAGREIGHFTAEQAALMAPAREWELDEAEILLVLELAAVNAALWQAEDAMRRLRGWPAHRQAEWTGFGVTFLEDVRTCAFQIQSLNDRRAALVAAINRKTGELKEGEWEKL